MRVSTAFNRMTGIDGATVTSVCQEPGVTVATVRPRRRLHVCVCGWATARVYDRSVRRWRHLDAVRHTLFVQAEICRVACPFCERVVTEVVSWARPGARHTRDFEDLVAWHTQRADKTTVCTLLRVSWKTVTGIVERVVADYLNAGRFDGLRRIGVDEISYAHGGLLVGGAHVHRDGLQAGAAARADQFVELGKDASASTRSI